MRTRPPTSQEQIIRQNVLSRATEIIISREQPEDLGSMIESIKSSAEKLEEWIHRPKTLPGSDEKILNNDCVGVIDKPDI